MTNSTTNRTPYRCGVAAKAIHLEGRGLGTVLSPGVVTQVDLDYRPGKHCITVRDNNDRIERTYLVSRNSTGEDAELFVSNEVVHV